MRRQIPFVIELKKEARSVKTLRGLPPAFSRMIRQLVAQGRVVRTERSRES